MAAYKRRRMRAASASSLMAWRIAVNVTAATAITAAISQRRCIRAILTCVADEIVQRLVERDLAVEIRQPDAVERRALDGRNLLPVAFVVAAVAGPARTAQLALRQLAGCDHDQVVPQIPWRHQFLTRRFSVNHRRESYADPVGMRCLVEEQL